MMKKILFGCAMLLAVGLLTTSCKKSSVKPEDPPLKNYISKGTRIFEIPAADSPWITLLKHYDREGFYAFEIEYLPLGNATESVKFNIMISDNLFEEKLEANDNREEWLLALEYVSTNEDRIFKAWAASFGKGSVDNCTLKVTPLGGNKYRIESEMTYTSDGELIKVFYEGELVEGLVD